MGEPLSTWLLAAVAVAGANLLVGLRGADMPTAHELLLLVLLAVTLTSAGLVAARSGGALATIVREERARPAAEELEDLHRDLGATPYVEGMRDWARAMLELIEHALALTDPEDADHVKLSAAADDTEAVLELLGTGDDADLALSDRATLHAVCTIWETTQAAVEQLAAQADRPWHRRWRARWVVAAGLRAEDHDQTFVHPFRT